jgi:hypothetical protein
MKMMQGSKIKYPKNYKLRKRLIKFLYLEGYSMLYIVILLGYDIINMGEVETVILTPRLKQISEGSNESRKKIIDEHLKKMDEKSDAPEKIFPPEGS